LTSVIDQCSAAPYRVVLAREVFDRFAMFSSAPDQTLAAPTAAGGLFDAGHVARYADVVKQMAVPYRVANGRAQRNTDIQPPRGDASDGIISSARDLARFVSALDAGALLSPATRAQAWTQTIAAGAPLPTGLGWFVQSYNGEPIVWQFGLTRGGHSSLMIKAPNRGITFIVLANSDTLNAPFGLESGDVTASVFARLFLRFFVP
jgi:CubicO group peptidase (beta-lactamase class C family)